MASKVFEKLYKIQLQESYNAQKQIIDAFPDLIKASGKELKLLLKEYEEQCKNNIIRFEAVAKKTKSIKLLPENCDVVEELLEEAIDWLEEATNGIMLDAGLVMVCKKLCHYEIALGETILSFARILANEKVIAIFEEVVKEKYLINQRLDEVMEDAAGVLVK